MHPNLHATHFEHHGFDLDATQDIVVYWPEPDLALLTELGAQRCNEQCWQLPHALAHRLPPGLSLGWVYGVARGCPYSFLMRPHPACLIVRSPYSHHVVQLQPHEALQDYFYPGHPETNFVTLYLETDLAQQESDEIDEVVVDSW